MLTLAYRIGTPAVNAAQSGVYPLVNAIVDFQKLKILTSGPVGRPNMRHCFLLVGHGSEIQRAIMSKNRNIAMPTV